ncbi:MAG: hypothetical protein GDA53_11285 [Rhodobacteraceae bacterium]|nr:hypothetical protein [Paracoccaceae bacterium]
MNINATIPEMLTPATCPLVFFGYGLSHTAKGTDGADTIYGRSSGGDYYYDNDRIEAGGGDDTVYGSDLPDWKEIIDGGSGSDTLYGLRGDDVLDGDAGDDTLHGGQGDDGLYGGADDDILRGNRGDDRLYGGSGNDLLHGGQGNDSLRGEAGNDVLRGGQGDDDLDGGDGDDLLLGGWGDDTLHGDTGSRDRYSGNDELYGGHGDDHLDGGKGNDTLRGQAGDDRLRVDNGRNFLHGGKGDDRLYGGKGSDTLNGGRGDDLMFGYQGADTFVFNIADFGHDTIAGFNLGWDGRAEQGDRIVFTGSAQPDSFDDLTFEIVNEREKKYIPADAKWIRGVGYDKPSYTEIVRDVLVTWGDESNSITLTFHELSYIRADDFIFA